MISICQTDTSGVFASHQAIEDHQQIPMGWFVAEPPSNLAAINVWNGEWVVVDERPPLPTPAVRTQKIIMAKSFWFLRLTEQEMIFFEGLEMQCSAMTVADLADFSKLHLTRWRIFLRNYNQLTNDIDLADPMVGTAVGLFCSMFAAEYGVSPEDTATRITELLAPPSQQTFSEIA